MNSMMTISHRLFASAVANGEEKLKRKPIPGKTVVIEVGRGEARPAWLSGRSAPSHPLISSEAWLGAARMNV